MRQTLIVHKLFKHKVHKLLHRQWRSGWPTPESCTSDTSPVTSGCSWSLWMGH